MRAEAHACGVSIVDATCPLVAGVHAEVRRLIRRGDTVVVIGGADHALAGALTGQAPRSIRWARTVSQVDALEIPDRDHAAYLVAPGLPVEEAAAVITALRARFPTARAQHPDGLCYSASDRAEALAGAARACDVLLVAGANDCADTTNVAERARAQRHAEVHTVTRVEDIQPHWLASAWCVGMTCARSAAPGIVAEAVTAISGLGPLSVAHREIDTHVVALDSPVRVGRQRPQPYNTMMAPGGLARETVAMNP
ncbi:4-hydroxy-3-methylbut-2-enyl diphosphate reductase [Actinocrispum wychmicini]|uniref:4-hydroxy-3-methylbut-2-enyl diphosphate reductase n=1 Tax=Actinocrispum wychmicini TaxID=1213861 RepID=A0A4R2ING4_9PSEU|nr:4-hydroxy-3-methylbut-2-enyl diphosphate reductase [Actinocrispum wychmicini]